MRDSRRLEEELASCSTQVIMEEPALRPAALRALRMARSLTDGEQSLTAESVLSAEIESIDTDISAAECSEVTAARAEPPPPFLFGKGGKQLHQPAAREAPDAASHLQRKPEHAQCESSLQNGTRTLQVIPGLDARAAELAEHAAALRDGPNQFNGSAGNMYQGLSTDPSTDPDFSALLEDIAAGPLRGPEALPPVSAREKMPPPQPATAESSSTAAPAAPCKPPAARPRPNPFRGFLSRRLPTVQGQKKETAAPAPATQAPAEDAASASSADSQPQPRHETGAATSGAPATIAAPGRDAPLVAEAPEEDTEEVLGLAISWLRAMYSDPGSNGTPSEALSVDVAFDRIAALMPRAPC
jgi:hypothetical protein